MGRIEPRLCVLVGTTGVAIMQMWVGSMSERITRLAARGERRGSSMPGIIYKKLTQYRSEILALARRYGAMGTPLPLYPSITRNQLSKADIDAPR